MRLRLARPVPGLLARVPPLAPRAAWSGDELVVPGPRPSDRGCSTSCGQRAADIRNLVAEEARLDSLYRELVEGSEPGAETRGRADAETEP